MSPEDQLASNAFFSKFDLHETLGTGAFSEVKVGIEKSTGAKYAIKIVDRSKCKGKEDMVETEVRILQMIKHENIVQLHEMYEFSGKIYLVMELVTGGELFDEIMGRGTFVEKDAASIVQKILLAVQYLHRMGIVHRDLKPENLLLSDRSKNPEIKISDFGLSKIFKNSGIMKTACGTPGYVAPEVLRKRGYGPQVDLWSLGVITYILLCGYPPFFDSNNTELFKKIMAGRYQFDKPWWDNISNTAKDFITKLLVVDPNVRWTASQALNHPFILENCFPVAQMAASDVVIPILKPIPVRYPPTTTASPSPSVKTSGPPNAPGTPRYNTKEPNAFNQQHQHQPRIQNNRGFQGPQQQHRQMTGEQAEYSSHMYSMYPAYDYVQVPHQQHEKEWNQYQRHSSQEEVIIDFGNTKTPRKGAGLRISSWFNFNK